MWSFCLHSIFREYGWQFLRWIAIPHPVKTVRAVIDSGALDYSGNMTAISTEQQYQGLEGEGSIIGIGFCMKPTDPPCLSGRANHRCHYLEDLLHSETKEIPVCCRQCVIREIGMMTLNAGAAFYIMCSAKDILFDLFIPSLNKGRFSSGLFVLCRYSLRPFTVGLLASGIRGCLFPFERGACRNYKSWLLSVNGINEKKTEINESNQKAISELLGKGCKVPMLNTEFERRGNILYPRKAGTKRAQRTDADDA